MAKSVRWRAFSSKLVSDNQLEILKDWYFSEERIISREEIAEKLGISRITLRKAFNNENPLEDLKYGKVIVLIDVFNEDLERAKELKKQDKNKKNADEINAIESKKIADNLVAKMTNNDVEG